MKKKSEYIIYEGNVLHACMGDGGRLFAASPVKMPDSGGRLHGVAMNVVERSQGGPVQFCGTYGLKGAVYEFSQPVVTDPGAMPKEAADALIGAGVLRPDADGNIRFSEDACYAMNHLPQPKRNVDVALRVGRTAAALAGLGALAVIAAPLLTSAAAVSLPVMTAGVFAAGFGVFEAVTSSRDVSRARAIGEMQALQGEAMRAHHDVMMGRVRTRDAEKSVTREKAEKKSAGKDRARAKSAARDFDRIKSSTERNSKGKTL